MDKICTKYTWQDDIVYFYFAIKSKFIFIVTVFSQTIKSDISYEKTYNPKFPWDWKILSCIEFLQHKFRITNGLGDKYPSQYFL